MYTVLLTSRRTPLGRLLAFVSASLLTTVAALFWQVSSTRLSPLSFAPKALLFGFPIVTYGPDNAWLRCEFLILAALFFVFAVRVMLLIFKRDRHWLISENRLERRVGARTDAWPLSAVAQVRVTHFGSHSTVHLRLTNGRWLKLPHFADDFEARDLARHLNGHHA